MPQDTYNIWFPHNYQFTQTICILQGLLSETSTNATVLTIASFTIERYIAICHPFRYVSHSYDSSMNNYYDYFAWVSVLFFLFAFLSCCCCCCWFFFLILWFVRDYCSWYEIGTSLCCRYHHWWWSWKW